MLSFNVIIFCYHFPPPFFLFPENVTHSVKCTIYYIQNHQNHISVHCISVPVPFTCLLILIPLKIYEYSTF
jgi:hypothetical protein